MTKRDVFKKNLCDELGLPCVEAIGESDEIIYLRVRDDDVAAKARVKAWLSAHHWVLDKVDERNIKIHPALSDVIHYKMIAYRHNNHKILIDCGE